MKVYITPDKVEGFSKKIYFMTRHMEVPPTVEFSEPKAMKQTTVTVLNNGWGIDGCGTGGGSRSKKIINVVEVTIDDITAGDWVLVASVFYQERRITMVNAEHFKEIPSQFGFGYAKCDYCGKTHSNRKDAHIIYNVKTGEWKQVGSSCINKMFAVGKYLSTFTVQLFKLVETFSGCCGLKDLGGWIQRQPDHYFQEAFNVDYLISAVASFRKNVTTEWRKASVDRNGYKIPGTTTELNSYFDEKCKELVLDEEYNSKVREFVKTLPEGEFNDGIKTSFANEYLSRREIYKVFFAIKMYEEFLTLGDWEAQKSKLVLGETIKLEGVGMVKKELVENPYWCTRDWYVVFKNSEGVRFYKVFSSLQTLETTCKNEDGTYSFQAKCSYINDKKREVKLGGRISRLR